VKATNHRTSDDVAAAGGRRVFLAGTARDGTARLDNRAGDYDVEEQALRALLSEQVRHRIREVLAGLPDEQRRVLRFRLFDGMSNVEIATLLGVTPQRVSQLWTTGFAVLWSALRTDPAIRLEDEEGATGD
jgi:RNA polymerase sigma factor (sigma-70 family)